MVDNIIRNKVIKTQAANNDNQQTNIIYDQYNTNKHLRCLDKRQLQLLHQLNCSNRQSNNHKLIKLHATKGRNDILTAYCSICNQPLYRVNIVTGEIYIV